MGKHAASHLATELNAHFTKLGATCETVSTEMVERVCGLAPGQCHMVVPAWISAKEGSSSLARISVFVDSLSIAVVRQLPISTAARLPERAYKSYSRYCMLLPLY